MSTTISASSWVPARDAQEVASPIQGDAVARDEVTPSRGSRQPQPVDRAGTGPLAVQPPAAPDAAPVPVKRAALRGKGVLDEEAEEEDGEKHPSEQDEAEVMAANTVGQSAEEMSLGGGETSAAELLAQAAPMASEPTTGASSAPDSSSSDPRATSDDIWGWGILAGVAGLGMVLGGGGGSSAPVAPPLLDTTPPEITGPSDAAGAASSVHRVLENATAVNTFTANETVTWSLNGGADAAQFSIDASTGELTFLTAPDFESPADSGADNAYTVVVRAVDAAGNAADQTVDIMVTNVHEVGDSIDLGTYGKLLNPVVVDGGQMYYVWDRNGDGVHNHADSGGQFDVTNHHVLDAIFQYDVNNVRETLDNAVGAVGDTDNTYRYATLNGVQVALPVYGSSMSGILASPLNLLKNGSSIDNSPAGEVNPEYDGLLAIWDAHNGGGTETESYGAPSGWSSRSGYWSATPSDLGHAHVTLSNGIVGDGLDDFSNYVALQVLSQITSTGTAATAENVATSAVVYDANGWTGDGVLTWSLQGPDAAHFNIDADDGEIRFLASPDVEAPADAGTNNVYDVTVRGTTTGGGWVEKAVAITVTNEVETIPVFTSAASTSVFENTGTSTAVYNAQTNVEGAADGATYTLGGSDAGLFDINASTGVVTFQASPNVAADTAYHIEVTATNAAGSDMQAVAITVRDIAATISLGGTWGNLIAPVQVDGGQVYYYWDRSGDGTSANAGALNGGVDRTTHDVLDAIFQYDANGVLETADNAVGAVGDTDNTYRYVTTPNGVQLALPTYGGTLTGSNASSFGYQNGTAIDNSPVGEINPAYDGLLAVWDAHNGGETEWDINGLPTGWNLSNYWSATPSALGHAVVGLDSGYVLDVGDNFSNFVALQVL